MSSADNPPPPPRRRIRWGIREHLRGYFIAGIVVTGPTLLTLYIIWLIVTFIDHSVGALLPNVYNPQTYLHVPGIGLIIVVFCLTLIGALTAGVLGRVYVRMTDRIITRMPVVRGIYAAVKQIFETVLAKQSNSFREVVLVEWPRQGMWTIAFVTAAVEGELQRRTGDDTIAVYVPTTPNPTSGYLMFVPRKDAITLEMSVEDAIKYVISTGIVTPPEVLAAAPGEPVETI
jgi:uncharacterized membrane protein